MGKLIFIDIDGTLFSTKINGTPQSALDAIAKARANGHQVFLCTGRGLAECKAYLQYEVDGYIFGAGANVYALGKCIYDEPIPTQDIAYIKRLINRHHMGYLLEGAAGAYCNTVGYDYITEYFSGGSNDPEVRLQNALKNGVYQESFQHQDEKIYKLCTYGHSWDDFSILEEKLIAPYVLTRAVAHPENHFYIAEITNGKINKGTGIQKVLDTLGMDHVHTVAIGDSDNDIPMFKKVNFAIAMGNASQGAKDNADYVTKDILEDGIAHALAYLELI